MVDTINPFRPYISMCFGVIAMGFAIKRLYPGSMTLHRGHKGIKREAQSGWISQEEIRFRWWRIGCWIRWWIERGEDMGEAFSLFVNVIGIILTFGNNLWRSIVFENLIPIVLNTIAIFVDCFNCWKSILQMIAVNYRSATTAGRFTDNAFALQRP